MRETLTRVLRSYGLARDEGADGLSSLPSTAEKTDCDFDPDAWDRGEWRELRASGFGRVVLSRLPAMDAMRSRSSIVATPVWRAVIELPRDASTTAIAALHALGVRGVRFDLGTGETDGLDPLLKFAERIVPFGWHVELKLGAAGTERALTRAEWRLMQFPLAVCFSNLCNRGQAQRAGDFAFLSDVLQLGRFWLKLSGDELAPPQLKLWDEPPPLAHALQAMRKDRLIWGSGKRQHGDGAAHLASGLTILEKCLPHPADREQVLVDNPAKLYGFDDDGTH